MRFQFPARLAAIISLMAVVGLMVLPINLDVRSAQGQAAATATPRSTSTPIAGVPGTGVPITYTVKSGDAFNAIARQFNLTPQQLQAFNAITNTSVIQVGQILIVGVSTFTPTPASTNTPAPTPTVAPTKTPTAAPTETSTVEPTAASTIEPTDELAPTNQPGSTSVPAAIEPAAAASAPTATSVPIDVVLVGVLMVFAVIGIFIGFRTQRY